MMHGPQNVKYCINNILHQHNQDSFVAYLPIFRGSFNHEASSQTFRSAGKW